MALALTVDSLDSVPENLRAAYVKDGDKFKLDADVEDTAGLKSALKKERDSRAALEKQAKKWEALGRSDEEIAAILAAQESEAHDKLKKKGDFDAILKQHQDKWAAEKTALESRLAGRDKAAREAIVDSAVLTALTKAKATTEGVDLLTERLGKRVKLEIGDDGKRTIHIMQADGVTPLAGKGADGTATFDDLIAEAVKNYPGQFEGTGAGGGGKPPKDAGGAGGKTITRADFDKLGPIERAATVKTHKIVD